MDKKSILNKILGKNQDSNLSGLVVSTKYPQLNVKNKFISDYPSLAGATKNDIYASKIQDITDTLKSSITPQRVGPQNNGGTINAVAPSNEPNTTLTYGNQPSDILLHEQLHNQFEKKNKGQEIKNSADVYPNTTKYFNVPSQKFDEAYNKYLSKNLNKSDKTIERMKYIENLLSKYYTNPEKSMKAPNDYDASNERYAYLGMSPDLIPKELKKYYKGVFKK